MAGLVDMKEVMAFLGIDSISTPDKNIDLLKSAVETWVQQTYCHQNLAQASYKELYDGTGTEELLLDHYPVISLNRLSIGTDDAISVKNTNFGTHASVSVSSTGITLFKDGVSTVITFATCPTFTSLVTAINALASAGWVATLNSGLYASFQSTVLLERFGMQCIANNWVYLAMPHEGEYDFEVYPKEGIIHLFYGFPRGHNNVYVDYAAGYATIPDNLKLAVLILIKNIYQRRSEESFGVTNYSISGISMAFAPGIPDQVKMLLAEFKRTLI